jgi:two-component system cell cycle response regulator DivK
MTAHRVLVVEDEEDNMNLFVQILHYHGCETLQARDGREAITVAQQELPDLILMDLSLPALDGWEATRAIKDIPDLAGIPVVALTAHAMVGDREKALDAGCDGYISKPIEVTAFFDELLGYLPDRVPSAPAGGA